MKPGALWLGHAFGPDRARAVAAAYREKLGRQDEAARLVLADLARYCRAGQSSIVAGDPHQTRVQRGARDVYPHVAEMIGLGPEELVEPARDAADER
jgi:hypothetical protein